jgi:hypothetical protein
MYDLDRTTVSELMATGRVRAAPALRLALLLGHALLSPSQVPRAPPNWQLNRSTIIMKLNESNPSMDSRGKAMNGTLLLRVT